MGNSNTEQSTPVTATGLKKTITVETEAGAVVVRRLALLDYGELLRAIKKLPGSLGSFIDGTSSDEFKESSNIEILEKLFPTLADSWEDFVRIMAVPTDKDFEFVGQLDGADSMEVFAAILELNNYKKIIATVKKLLPQKAKKTDQAVQEKTPQD